MNLKLYLDCTSGQVQPRPTQPDPENWVGSGWSSQANGRGDSKPLRVAVDQKALDAFYKPLVADDQADTIYRIAYKE